jgi:hypothetical protein
MRVRACQQRVTPWAYHRSDLIQAVGQVVAVHDKTRGLELDVAFQEPIRGCDI